MDRELIIEELKDYFIIQELVGPDTYKLLGEESWQVYDTDTLHCLLLMRLKIDKPFTVNNWHKGGSYDERGFRSNIQPIVKSKTEKNQLYLSGHLMGKAIDFTVKDMTPEQVRDWIEQNADIFPCKIRLEWKKKDTNKNSPTFGKMIPITWVHFDTKQDSTKPKIYKFNV